MSVKALCDAIYGSIEGEEWPADAQFAVTYKLKCWPCDYGDSRTVYFKTVDELDAWKAEYREWSRLEDNCVRFYVEKWDLCPTVIDSQEWS